MVPVVNGEVHSVEQLFRTEDGVLVIVPLPVTVTVNSGGSFQLGAGV